MFAVSNEVENDIFANHHVLKSQIASDKITNKLFRKGCLLCSSVHEYFA
jgi:hypothetical protein